jgi:branched-chain amino acid transport system ATP-binding protein
MSAQGQSTPPAVEEAPSRPSWRIATIWGVVVGAAAMLVYWILAGEPVAGVRELPMPEGLFVGLAGLVVGAVAYRYLVGALLARRRRGGAAETRVGATPAGPSANGDSDLILSVEDIHVYYGTIQALKGISLEVRRGEIVTLIGANGAGKSTTLRSINGLNHPREGKIVFQGVDITETQPHEIVSMGISQSPEGRHVFVRMSVLENLEMGAYQRDEKAAIQEDLERVFGLFPRLQERRTQKAGTLSGGEQQMLAMGRALMARPRLLLLDEPSMGLAPIFVEKIFEIVGEINSQGTPILLVEQNALMALDIADRGYVLETGRVALADDAKALRDNEQVRKTYLGEE